MVPALLSLRNFLCYRDNCPPLDFTGVEIACLTGENGNGKSALLDAMTWAIWGQARARTDDELIHLGRTEMEVEFEFLAGDQRYRVIRKRKKGTQRTPGTTSLEFHLEAPEGWKPLTANHVRETERRVRDVLKLDYETFVNSAFLLQGRADAFTVKTPGERKRILAEILGLSQYDELEQAARYERGLRDDQARSLERELGSLRDALAHEPAYQAERQQLTAALAGLDSELVREAERLERLRQAERLLALQRQQAEAAERRRVEAETEVGRARRSLDERRKAIARYEATIATEAAIEDGYRRLQDAIDAERSLGERLGREAALHQARAECQAAIERARVQLVAEEQRLAGVVERLRAAIEEGQRLAPAQAVLDRQAASLEEEQGQVDRLRSEEQDLRERAGALRAENSALRAEMDAIKLKQTELSTATVCPLCRTELGEAGQAHVVAAYEADGKKLAAQYREARGQIQQHEQRLASTKKEIETLDVRLRQARAEHAREAAVVESALRKAADAAVELGDQPARLELLGAQLAAGNYARDHRARLASLEAEIAALGYDAGGHEAARQTVRTLRQFDGKHRELELARAQRETERVALQAAERLLLEWQGRLETSTTEFESARALLTEQPDPSSSLAESQSRCERLRVEQRRHQQAIGAVEQKLDDCARYRQQEATKTTALKQALEERGIYEELTLAFSRRGIQALIIDHVIPEITEEANRLLGRMTNNRLRVMIDTQRETLRGSVTETLDIRISDELGTRNYELFSGGEAFRVNLALRIALSKLLARRAGAPLPTLVIDEGFGSQDAAALERLVEAINVIRPDFRCLLIITHLAELKDQFPVQIAVSKTEDGAVATIAS